MAGVSGQDGQELPHLKLRYHAVSSHGRREGQRGTGRYTGQGQGLCSRGQTGGDRTCRKGASTTGGGRRWWTGWTGVGTVEAAEWCYRDVVAKRDNTRGLDQTPGANGHQHVAPGVLQEGTINQGTETGGPKVIHGVIHVKRGGMWARRRSLEDGRLDRYLQVPLQRPGAPTSVLALLIPESAVRRNHYQGGSWCQDTATYCLPRHTQTLLTSCADAIKSCTHIITVRC